MAIPKVARYHTPLGEMAVDRSIARTLCSAAPFRLVDEEEACDHSVEIQLPLLQRAAPSACVVPLYVGQMEEQERTVAAEALARACRPGDVLMASSDLTHYGLSFGYVPFPVDTQTAGRLRVLDRLVIEAVGSVDSELFLDVLRKSGATVCGYQPMSLLLRTLSLMDGEEIFQQELDYQTSGEITGDFSESVSYAALGYFPTSSFELSEMERRFLLLSARETLAHLRETGERGAVPPFRLQGLERRVPVFVTLRHEGRLIGCMGCVFQRLSLAEAVPQMTLAAALDDPRHASAEGIPQDIEIEISVLTPMKLIRRTGVIRAGTHGAYLVCGARRAFLLPQVARPDWTAKTFLDALFRKAGLDPAAWGAPEPRIYAFQAQRFGG